MRGGTTMHAVANAAADSSDVDAIGMAFSKIKTHPRKAAA